jgi:SPP1 gp7 family putative phage head morphogenesis protein
VTTSPVVELTYGNLKLTPYEEAQLQRAMTLEEAVTHGLWMFRVYVIREFKKQLPHMEINPGMLSKVLDELWATFMPTFGRVTGPYLVSAYAEGFLKARSGDIAPGTLNALADDYADRMGTYFHTTSREALIQGFNTFVNRKMPPRLAAERSLEAFGLSPRQMGGYTSAKFDKPVESGQSQNLKRKINAYIAQSLGSRFKIFAEQESHNISQQAQQVAWNYLVSHGQLTETAEKVWLTAKDERVCPSCGPLHGKRANVTDKFENGLYVPGVHVNCRCEIRLVTIPVGKAEEWEEEEHPRARDGRFSAKSRQFAAPLFKPVTLEDRPTPALDEMIAGAEKLREQLKERVEEKDERVRLDAPKVRLHENVSLGRVSLQSGPVTLESHSEPVRLSEPETRVQLSTERVRLDEPAPRPKPEPEPDDGYLDLTDIPLYAFMSPDTHPISMDYQFRGERFFHNELIAFHAAEEWRNDKIAKAKIRILGHTWSPDERIVFSHIHPRFGESGKKGVITADDVEKVIGAVAAYDAGEDSLDEPMLVTWEDENGELFTDQYMPIGDIAAELGVNEGDFAVRVVKLEKVHRELSNDHPDSHVGAGHWDISGDYSASDDDFARNMIHGQRFAIPTYTLYPTQFRPGTTG